MDKLNNETYEHCIEKRATDHNPEPVNGGGGGGSHAGGIIIQGLFDYLNGWARGMGGE